ncbi:4-hydroxy-2-oxovalerate aldolase [Metallumcola ferriviriculae]|uniref:4-hydroxy-2-oxovalerate aldolase n=1 Tax=Metallumcola ferriviriculae TaxID=3039180 RepID=A0AAU0UL93_9FIRM|nr:4-hydroxy-2-oxovalerate aldolase [Desulfitibacteraceae bacterium MK1]
MSKHIRIVDTTLRDGMHAVSHRFTPDDMAEIAAGLDAAGIDTIEIGHGDGLAGSSFQYGFAAATDEDYLKAVSGVLKNAKLDVLLLPGIGTMEELELAAKYNAKVARVATHVTEADIGEQHLKLAKELGMEAVGFLMMSHMVGVDKVVEQAKLFESYGADKIYVTDSAGAMTPKDVTARIKAVKEAVSVPIGHHAHNNLSLAVANTLAAVEAGADMVDGTCKGLGAGAGNTQTEVLVAVLDKLGYDTGIDLYKIMDVADDIVVPKMKRAQVIDKNSLSIGYAGVYGSFLLHSLRAAEKFQVDARDILVELGKRKTVGGQEDMIVDVAYELSQKQAAN